MPVGQNDVTVVGATRLVIGQSQILRVIAPPNAVSSHLKYVSGGSLEIVQPAFSGASTSTAGGWGTGYVLGTTEVFQELGPATFYLSCGVAGATTTAALAWGFSSGATAL